jgi:hypothetical protein
MELITTLRRCHLGNYQKALFHLNTILSIFIPSLGDSHVTVAAKEMAAKEKNIGNMLFEKG